ncbi:uncharacterized protein MYCFIDRAFT_200440 [Pseudocercospora fijiensis CIRAD86]|uniref:Uncharacterized protein n=1 Tax=Pseudocercospora fijiensis (strain CIRAD86) TaxID=383855 RepID=M3AKY0_PSEFD|nr:uncharacterized protein MYCFIDRAFT_200440 [Pseudocercospora fijiensis CIRAD86]EME78117.1 hypothetical protein MYCFIDRAFT_200440 [Pseudocercospora fijiensis CIRAD86]
MDLLPPLPSEAYATRLFNNRPKTLRHDELLAVAYYYTNKELVDRDNEDRVASGKTARSKSSNIITKWITEAVQLSAIENDILPSLMRRLFDIRRYNILKHKQVSDDQSVRSLHSLVVSDHHAPKFVTFSDNPTWDDLKPYLGKQWGRAPDSLWPALLSIVGPEGRNMADLRMIMENMENRNSEESAYGLVADIRRLGPPLKKILENHQRKTQKCRCALEILMTHTNFGAVKLYAEAEVRKIKDEDLSVAKKGIKKAPRKKVSSEPTALPKQETPKKATSSRVKSEKAESSKAGLSRPLRTPQSKRVTRQNPQPAPEASPSPEQSPAPSAVWNTDGDVETEIEVTTTTAPALPPPSSSTSTPEPSAEKSVTEPSLSAPAALPAFETLTPTPVSAPLSATHYIQKGLIVWSAWLGASLAAALDQNLEDKIIFGHFITKNQATIYNLQSCEHHFFCYMLATLISWCALPVATRMRPFQHLEAAAVLFLNTLTANPNMTFIPFDNGIFRSHDEGAKAWYLLLFGLAAKYTIDPLGPFTLPTIVAHFGNTMEKRGLNHCLEHCEKTGCLPRYIDPSTERYISLEALRLWLDHSTPKLSLMEHFLITTRTKVFCPYPLQKSTSFSLSDRSIKSLAEATSKLSSTLKLLSNRSPGPPRSTSIAKSLAQELGKETFDPSYLCPYFGFFEGEFPDDEALKKLGAFKLPKEMSWREAGKRIGEGIRGWLEGWEDEKRGVWEYVLGEME